MISMFLSYQLIESEIQANQDQVDTIMAQVRAFREAGHFQIEQIEDRGRELVAKWVLWKVFVWWFHHNLI